MELYIFCWYCFSEMALAHSSPPSSTSPNASRSLSKVVRKRDGRGTSKLPTGRMTITEVSDVGVPLCPKKAATRFQTICGILVRERVPNTTPNWKSLTSVRRGELWTELSSSFNIPKVDQACVERQVLLRCVTHGGPSRARLSRST